jgi:transposase-like protein
MGISVEIINVEIILTIKKTGAATNAVERLHQELKRRSKVVRIFPNPKSYLRLFGAMLKEQHEDWITGRRYLKMDQLEKFQENCPDQFGASEDPPKKPIKPAMA